MAESIEQLHELRNRKNAQLAWAKRGYDDNGRPFTSITLRRMAIARLEQEVNEIDEQLWDLEQPGQH